MNTDLSFGEYVRRLRRAKRWELQQLAEATGLSVWHLSRVENGRAIPNAETVTKLATALDGDLQYMLELADCLPREILERLVRRASDGGAGYRRSAGSMRDRTFPRVLVEDMDPSVRMALAQLAGLSEDDAEGLYAALQRVGQMAPRDRELFIALVQDLVGRLAARHEDER